MGTNVDHRQVRSASQWGDIDIPPGESRDVAVEVAKSYSGGTTQIPVHVRRGASDGPTLFVTAAVHGDEINGAGAIRELILDESLQLQSGCLILVPVINVLAFERHSRYLPDRRDLNRTFPGSLEGSLASRYARIVFDEIVQRSDYGIDLHTAAVRRTNFPNVRGDMSNPDVAHLARAFGCEVIVDGVGPKGCFRSAACKAGCPTIMLEAGEVWKAEPAVIEYAVRGVKNVLCSLGMIAGKQGKPSYQSVITTTKWVRSGAAGFLQFHVAPGDLVEQGVSLATVSSLLGHEEEVLVSPGEGIILGMTTLPVTAPGEPVCHLGMMSKGISRVSKIIGRLPDTHLHERIRDDLATNITVVEPEEYDRGDTR